MKKEIILRADAGKSIGFGHLIRSLALAGYLKKDFRCRFCSFDHDGDDDSYYPKKEILKECDYIPVQAGSIDEFNKKFLSFLKGDEIVVLDNYYFSSDFQKAIKDKGCTLVCIDDIHDRKMECDLLLTGLPLSRDLYDITDSTKFLGGLQYMPLRNPFLKNLPEKRISTDPLKVVLAVGGADPFNLTQKIAEIIVSVKPEIHLTVIPGSNSKIDSLKHEGIKIVNKLSADELSSLFDESDLGVFPASTISIEALSRHLPVAAGWFVDNQKELYDFGVKTGLFLPLGNFFEPEDLLKEKMIKAFINISDIAQHNTHAIDFQKGKKEIIETFKSL